MIAMLMDGGQAEFGDMEFMKQCLEDIRVGNERGQLLAQGTARIGKHFNIARVPVIKEQAISAYDHRVVEVTGISMMVVAQGADHTTGNGPTSKCDYKTIEVTDAESYKMQANSAVADSIGLYTGLNKLFLQV